MNINLKTLIKPNEKIAVALSGGKDSMCLLHYLLSEKDHFGFSVMAINVEHGIRGNSSLSDSAFVKDYCEKQCVPLLSYSVDCKKIAKEKKLSLEQAGRLLRYEIFFNALKDKKCDKVATAHHLSDNVESVLLNLFRGTGISGVSGITDNFSDKIIRPLLSVSEDEIKTYVEKNNIPFVTDETNLSDDYTRNFLRLNVIPKIKEVFPEMETSVKRFSDLAKQDDDFLYSLAKENTSFFPDKTEIPVSLAAPVFSRAVILSIKSLGVSKDWTKKHVDSVYSLIDLKNGSKISLLKNLFAIREYDKIVIYKGEEPLKETFPFSLGKTAFFDFILTIKKIDMPKDLKSGLFSDFDKIPESSVIRTKKVGDVFKKFGGGTKSLGDYFTDIKIPLRERNFIPLLANGNEILCIFGKAVSDKIKIDENTKNIVAFSLEKNQK